VGVLGAHPGGEFWGNGGAENRKSEAAKELARLTDMARYADSLGLEVHAGHGLTYESVAPIAALPEVVELNIGHFLIGEAIFLGLDPAIKEMRRLMDAARNSGVMS